MSMSDNCDAINQNVKISFLFIFLSEKKKNEENIGW